MKDINMLEDKFMLSGGTAKYLYNTFAKCAPIYDYHCHLSAKEIDDDKEFSDISSLWLQHDHYKWRAMRYAGVSEELITGNGDGLEKFIAWAQVCEKLIGSPLYHWANMELQRYFGIKEILNAKNAREIYKDCNDLIRRQALSPVKMIQQSKVKLICTTDDPVDNLEYHIRLAKKSDLGFQVRPTFRPDKSLQILKEDFIPYLHQLEGAVKSSISDYSDFIRALKSRVEYFKEQQCVLADHSLESLQYFKSTEEEVGHIFAKRLQGEIISQEEAEKFKVHTLTILAKEYKKAGWVMQLHLGAYRNSNTERFKSLGPDTGFDIMNDFSITEPLVRLLDGMEQESGLPKTILYNLNSKDNLVLSSIPHCFTEEKIQGKVQFGPAWWFCDHKEGILSHFKSIASQGMLAGFVGMLTDSRSFLSYVRHDYFRRILCSYIGELVEAGEFAEDENVLGEIIEGICYKNIINYLGLED